MRNAKSLILFDFFLRYGHINEYLWECHHHNRNHKSRSVRDKKAMHKLKSWNISNIRAFVIGTAGGIREIQIDKCMNTTLESQHNAFSELGEFISDLEPFKPLNGKRPKPWISSARHMEWFDARERDRRHEMRHIRRWIEWRIYSQDYTLSSLSFISLLSHFPSIPNFSHDKNTDTYHHQRWSETVEGCSRIG